MSDPTLLEILSLGSDPPSVVPHFQSGLFDSLTNVTFDRVDKQKMTEMFSQQNECVEFERAVEAKGNIEVWLQRLVDSMQDTVKQIIKRAVRNVQEMPLEDFVFGHPAQISLLGIQFQWTADTQAALSAAKTDKFIMSKNMKKVDGILRDMVNITVRTDLTRIQRINLETCITVHMHQKESTEDLIKHKIKDPTDFEWLKQVRRLWYCCCCCPAAALCQCARVERAVRGGLQPGVPAPVRGGGAHAGVHQVPCTQRHACTHAQRMRRPALRRFSHTHTAVGQPAPLPHSFKNHCR